MSVGQSTGVLYVLAPDLKAGMRCSIVVNEPLYEVEDVAVMSADRIRVAFFGGPHGRARLTYEVYDITDKIEVHYTRDGAIALYYELERAEANAFQVAYDLGEKRSTMAAIARGLGWRG